MIHPGYGNSPIREKRGVFQVGLPVELLRPGFHFAPTHTLPGHAHTGAAAEFAENYNAAADYLNMNGYERMTDRGLVEDVPANAVVMDVYDGGTKPEFTLTEEGGVLTRVEFTAEEFREKVLSAQPDADLSGDMSGWLQNAVTDTAGSVETVEVGGVTVKGSTLRSILGLRSACFEWEAADGKLVFFVTGYGHGVGMSQYGANQMAKEGADYREILTHYYTGVTVEPYTAAAMG